VVPRQRAGSVVAPARAAFGDFNALRIELASD
jgi:hypothetical protein